MSPYFLYAATVSRTVYCVMDLGYELSYNLDPSAHIEYVSCKTLKTLGLIMRSAKDFWLELS